MRNGAEIKSNADMDDFDEVGNFYCPASATTQTLKNCPFKNAFTLKVIYATGVNYPAQIFKEFNTGRMAYRYYNSSASTPSWQPFVYFSDDATVLNGRGNIIKASNTVPAVYGESFVICSIELEQDSDYLVVGCTSCSTNINEQISCMLRLLSGQGASFFGITNTRTTGQNGGGVVNAALVNTSNQKATISLESYGYSNETYNMSGYLFAIKLK